MSETDQKVLKNLADLIAREFELGFERRRNAVAKAQTDYLGQLFRSLNVGPSPSVTNQETEAFAHVASNLVSLTSASYCAIIDLRSFQLSSGTPFARPSRRLSADTNIPAVTPSTSFASAPPVYPNSAPSPPSRLPFKRNTSFDSLPTTSRTGSTNGSLAADGATMSGNSGAEMSLDSQPREEEMITFLSTRGGRRESDGGRFAMLDAAVAPDVDLQGWVSWDNALGIEKDDDQQEGELEETEEDARVRARNRSEAKGKAADAKRAVSAFLMDYYRSNQAHFDASSPSASLTGPLASILPSGTTAYVAVPCFFDGDATLMIVLGSTTRHFQFELADRDFAQNVGAILMGSLLRRRLLEADKAKLHFLSQISHELRTPLHGIGSYLELIRDVAQPEALATINPLLSMTDVCVTSLREILDSVLSFSKLYNADAVAALSSTSRSANGDRPTHAPITRTLVDLEELIVDVVKSCWTTTLLKSQALQGVSADGVAAAAQAQREKVDIILEFDLPRGTLVAADVGGLKRVLVNLLGNSLKYTSVGKVVIAVSAPKLSSRTGVEDILIDIADTGKGMSPEFVRERLFLPFSQEDPFKEGNGLGTAIADSLLRGMGGTLRYSSALGSGTTASISVPLEICIPPSSELPPPPQSVLPRLAALGKPASARASVERRVLSDELSAMLHPIKLAGSPSSNKPSPLTGQPVTIDSAPYLPRTSTASFIAVAPPPADSQSSPGAFGSRLPATVLPPFSPPLTPPSLAGAGILPLLASTDPVAEAPVEAPLTVLVADDNPIARRVLTTFLRSRRIAYVEAENGVEAVSQFLAARPSLVWMDVQMPVKDGLEATQEIRAIEGEKGWQKARVVVLSGLSKELGKHEQYLKCGLVDHWITKSGSLKQLSADLEAYRSSVAAASPTSAGPPPSSINSPAFISSASRAAAVPPITA